MEKTRKPSQFQRMRREIASESPASVLERILKKYQDEKGLGGQDMLPHPTRTIKPVMVTCSSTTTFSQYVRNKHSSIIGNRISSVRGLTVGKVEGAVSIPKANGKQEIVLVDLSCDADASPPPYQRIIENIMKTGKKKIEGKR